MKYKEYIIGNIENKRVLIITDIHNCHKEWYQTANQERMEFMCEALQKEYDKAAYDCVLCLGDYSLDFWKGDIGGSYLSVPSVSRTEEFMKKYYPKFPAKTYMIPGNHEQYGNKKWKEITGFDREYSIVYGEHVFVMLDTFAGELDPTENSDGVYSGINIDFLQEVLKNHPDKKIILCAHYFDPEKESNEVRELIVNEKRIQCIFVGHRHISTTVFLDESWRNFPVIFCGNFSYYRQKKNVTLEYYGDVFTSFIDETDGQWGYRVLHLQDKSLCTDYVQVSKSKF